jgi:hypothetical protein
MPSARRTLEPGRSLAMWWAPATAWGEDLGLRVVMVRLPFEPDWMSIVFELARPEYLCECKFKRLPCEFWQNYEACDQH